MTTLRIRFRPTTAAASLLHEALARSHRQHRWADGTRIGLDEKPKAAVGARRAPTAAFGLPGGRSTARLAARPQRRPTLLW